MQRRAYNNIVCYHSSMKAIFFSLQDQDGNIRKLSDFAGKWLILYFYPKDDTPGCTKEACNFSARANTLQNMNAVVAGISKDSVNAHKKFIDKYHLNVILLSDPDLKTIKDYNAWGKKKFMGREFSGTLRITYLINPEGTIVKKFENVNPTIHAEEVMNELQTLNHS